MYYTSLPARGLISLSGDDTIPFLQGLITNDARKLEQGKPLYAALLSPQGKYLHDFFLVPQNGQIILDGEKHRLADLKQRLSMYKLRSKVAIGMLPESNGVVVLWGGTISPPLAGGIKGGNTVGYFGKDADTTRNRDNMLYAKEMRSHMTDAEYKLWQCLSGKKLEGFKFRRQQTIGAYIVDFVCMEKHLVIEVDGGQHSELEADYNTTRTKFLEGAGYRIVRFWNNDVIDNIEGVCAVILESLQADSPLLPSPVNEGSEFFADPRMDALGVRMVGNIEQNLAWCAAQGFDRASVEAYDKHRILNGVPDGSRDMTPDKSLMLEFNMDVLNAVDFSKGCYVGQEVTARTKYRAQIKKTLCVIEAQQGVLPDAGATLIAAEKDIGQMLSSVGNVGLALMRTEALTQDKTVTLADGTVVTMRELVARG